jgi:hypothetical protein
MSREPWNTPNEFSDPLNENRESKRFGDIQDRFKDVESKTRERAAQIRDEASETIDRQRRSAASGLDRVASTIHEKAEHIPGGARKAADMAHSVARGMESTASYLRGHDLTDMRADLMNLSRRYPTQSLLSALAIGFLVGRAVRR